MGAMKDRMRLDLLLVERGLAESREKARAVIMAGLVEVDQVRLEKPGQLVSIDGNLSLKKSAPPYVSRGGLKLKAALQSFSVDVKDRVVLDVGASTGGFTDCLLQGGARKVIAVDVGHGQLDWRLRRDPRVVLMEKTNARYLSPDDIEERADGAVIDVSFISLRLVIPPVSGLLTAEGWIVALIKPQFEVGKGQVGKGGVVRDPRLHQEVVGGLKAFCEGAGWAVKGRMESPLLGPKGNKEFLIHLKRQAQRFPPPVHP
ncbi:MAG: TlyA family RNA methyltransferase [Deltaproteobacteria bacterium]|nr:TlyA family RNA methyltransferase [Deltaproteobacteria bacterium]